MSDDKVRLRKEETHCLLVSMREYESTVPINKNSNSKKWPYILETYNHLIKHAKRCKQTRTLRVRYQKLVSMYSSANKAYLQKFCHNEDIDLLRDTIALSSKKNKTSTGDISNSAPNTVVGDDIQDMVDEYSTNEDDEQPLDTIKVLPRSSYLSTKKDQLPNSSTDTASPSNNSNRSYGSMQKHDMNNGGKKLSMLYGAAMMEDDVSVSTSEMSRDLEIQQMKETIISLQDAVGTLENKFAALMKSLNDLK